MDKDKCNKNRILVVGNTENDKDKVAGLMKDDCQINFVGIDDVLQSCSKAMENTDVIVADKETYLKCVNRILDYDGLTGLYTKDKFFRSTREVIDANPDIQFVFVRFDINRFSLINSYYGRETGDMVLQRIASGLRKTAKHIPHMTYGRIDADIFGACMPFPGKERFERYLEESTAKINEVDIDFSIVLVVGAYIIDERDIPVDTMCVRATLAIKNLNGRHLEICNYYNNEMRINLESDQRIINEMNQALASGQFVPYFQPKYDVITNKPVGAEALARWIHPTRGVVSPAEFIPVFERNGFISKLDFYIWEQVCKYIADWKKRGLPIYPVSVNVSRMNLYNPNLVNVITSLTEKYGIEPKYLNLELTESLYTEMNEIISRTTGKLQSKGFVIMMDDFGSGYSSLNVLKDVPVDVLKMDMRFMSKSKKEGRAENILASVVRMAKWLNMPVVAEGVDKKEQVDFLRGVGCDYIQGFYYAKPMPAEEYEKLIASQQVFEDKNSENENGGSGWNAASAKIAIESSPLPTGIFEYFPNNRAEIISVNHAFYETFGYEFLQFNGDDMVELLSPKEKAIVYEKTEEAIRTDKSADCTVAVFTPKKHRHWLRISLKCYAKTDISYIIIATINDITTEKKLNRQAAFFSESISREHNRRKNILLVTPDNETVETISGILGEDYNINSAENCRDGFKYMLENQVDMIMCDTEEVLPDITEFIGKVRAEQGDDRITIAVILTDISPESQQHIYDLGADDFILNPFVAATVKNRTKNMLEYC